MKTLTIIPDMFLVVAHSTNIQVCFGLSMHIALCPKTFKNLGKNQTSKKQTSKTITQTEKKQHMGHNWKIRKVVSFWAYSAMYIIFHDFFSIIPSSYHGCYWAGVVFFYISHTTTFVHNTMFRPTTHPNT